MTDRIDLNADLGESFGAWTMGEDASMLDIVTSANIACGFHGGDPLVMDRTVRMAMARGVGIGAHPGFDDLSGFGRRRIHGTSPEMLRAQIIYQIGALQAIARAAGGTVRHVKLHGALGNMASEQAELAELYVAAAREADPGLILIAIAATELEKAAVAGGARVAREIYADRAYRDDGALLPRSEPGAVIHDPAEAAERVLRCLDQQAVASINGVKIPVTPQTICVHGDNPAAVAMAETLRSRLEAAGITIALFEP